jgi:uncharacterized RDD family membrane protein YckC
MSPTPGPDASTGPTRLKTPSVLWRRFGALGADYLLSAVLGITTTFFLIDYPVFMKLVACTVFGMLWLGAAMNTGATPGMWLVELRHRRRDPEKLLPVAMTAKFTLTWLPIQLLDILYLEQFALSWQSPDASPPQTTNPFVVFGVVSLFWYTLLLISTLSTRGKRNLADLICGTAVDLSRERFLSTGRRITAWGLGVVAVGILVMASFIGALDSTELQAAEPDTSWTADPVATYQPEEIHAAYQDRVFQVTTRWNRSRLLGLLSTHEGVSGSALLFVNDREYGLLVSNLHVVGVGSGYQGGYECAVDNDLQSEPVGVEIVAVARNEIDLALLLIRVDDWEPWCVPVMPISGLQVGEEAVALGNALSMGISATSGNISRIDEIESMVFIQSSAPISPGNSGGPLILTRGGYVCGINTLTSNRDSAQNVNFAIPAEYVLYDELWEFRGHEPRVKALLAAARECLQ